MAEKKRKVSILIASRNARDDLPKLFASLGKISYPKSMYEVVFVDDGSTDGSWEIARKFGARVFRFKERRGRAEARNKALRLAKHPLVAWIDSDCEIADRDWIQNMMKHIGGKVVGVAGNQLRPRSGLSRVLWYLPGTAYTAGHPGPASFAPTTSSLFLKKPLLEVGGFDPKMITAEDLEICWRLGERGYRFVKTNEAEIYHNFRSTMTGFERQQFERGEFGAYLFRKYDRGVLWKKMDKMIFLMPFAGTAVLLFPSLIWVPVVAPALFHFGLGYVNFFPAVMWNYLKNERSPLGLLQLVAAEYVKTYATLLGMLAYQIKNLKN
ncbi:MAG: glycosyltransferase [Candidatus Aenigmarchaeota archaeon]|nr:glycosyltransferase [Candidatus Aenigmarchaeota archaeon]